MKKDNFKTDVIFRNWNTPDFNCIIAVFPYEINDLYGGCLSYQHLGQHSGMDYPSVINGTIPAKENEYIDLKSELESIGYNLNIIKRRNYNKYLCALNEVKKQI
jgi:hypothetical protein